MGAHGDRGDASAARVWPLRIAVLTVALLAALISWAATRDGDEGSPAAAESASRQVSEEELVEAGALLGQPIFWAGPLAGTTLELEELEDGVRVKYVREDGGEALTVSSYALPDPVGDLKRFAAQPGAVAREARGGTEVFYAEDAPNSVYFADPTAGVQVEVYAPSPAVALQTALSGGVERVK
jgi:hypothetical protein